jgi:hypothetical protein
MGVDAKLAAVFGLEGEVAPDVVGAVGAPGVPFLVQGVAGTNRRMTLPGLAVQLARTGHAPALTLPARR